MLHCVFDGESLAAVENWAYFIYIYILWESLNFITIGDVISLEINEACSVLVITEN